MSIIANTPAATQPDPVARDYAARLNASRIPAHLHDGLIRYLAQRIEPGSFLLAVLQNNLFESVRVADPVSLAALPDLLAFLYHDTPGTCWGSVARVRVWLQGGVQR